MQNLETEVCESHESGVKAGYGEKSESDEASRKESVLEERSEVFGNEAEGKTWGDETTEEDSGNKLAVGMRQWSLALELRFFSFFRCLEAVMLKKN